MKTLKSIIVVVLMSMMTITVFAQTVSQNKSNKPAPAVLTEAECKAYIQYMSTHTAMQMQLAPVDSTLLLDLFQHANEPAFVVVPTDTIISGRNYVAGDSLGAYIIRTDMLRLFSYPIRSNAKEVAAARALDRKLFLAAARAHAVEELNEGRPRSGSEIAAKLSNGQEVTIPEKMSDDFGWSAVVGVTYQGGEGRYSFGGEIGIRYTHHLNKTGKWFFGGQALGSLRKTYFNDNATTPGENYTAYGTVFDAIFGYAFGTHRELRVSGILGLNWEFFKTLSQPKYYPDGSWDELQSWGNFVSPEAKLMLEYCPINWPVSFYLAGGVRQFVSPWQGPDDNTIRRFDPHAEVGFTIELFRHWTNNK